MATLKFENFPCDDRIWRLNWIGEVENFRPGYLPSKIRLSFSPVIDSSCNRFSAKSVHNEINDWVMVNIGALPMLRLGSLWKNGTEVRDIDYECDESVFNVRSSLIPQFMTLRDLVYPSVYAVGGKCCYTPCLVLDDMSMLSTSNPKMAWRKSKPITTVVIPCTEILRFYFGTSSTIIRKLIHGAAMNINEVLIIKESNGVRRSGVVDGGKLCLTLRKNISDINAWPIVRILFDKIAAMTTRDLYKNILDSRARNEKSYIKMNLPFEGQSNLKSQGIWLGGSSNQDNREFFLVTRLLSCTADIPFKGLILDRENSNRVKNHDGEEEIGYPDKSKPKNSGEEFIAGFGVNPANDIQSTEFEIQEERFPALKKKIIEFVVKNNAKYRTKKIYIGSDVIGYETGLRDSENLNIAPLEIVVDIQGNTQKIEETVVANIYTLWKAIRYLNRWFNVKATVVHVDSGKRTLDFKLSQFPTPKQKSKWPYFDDGKGPRARRALWIEIFKDNRWFYVVEWEGKPTEFGITLMQQHAGANQTSKEELQLVMFNWATDAEKRRIDGLGQGWLRESMHHIKDIGSDSLPYKLAKKLADRMSRFKKQKINLLEERSKQG